MGGLSIRAGNRERKISGPKEDHGADKEGARYDDQKIGRGDGAVGLHDPQPGEGTGEGRIYSV